ncbi:MAG: RNA polymerase sigma-70 factor (ECF subfamily) [Planctomycetota bacterium]|jgi:RNA polymerase sigma-70 factor (ECF subfamily)
MDAVRLRQPAGLDELVDEHANAVYEFILYRVGRRQELAEDIAQETLLAAVKAIEGFDGRSTLRTWLFGIAKNKIREALRASSRSRPLGDILLDADDEIFATLGRIAEEPIPDEILEREETKAMVGATLSSLPESYRTALTERYIEGHSVPETARRQGRGVKAAESTLHRAKRAFADIFGIVSVSAAGKEELR